MLKKSISIVAVIGLITMGAGEASARGRSFGAHGFGGGHAFGGGFARHGGFGGVRFAGRRGGFGRGLGYGDAMAGAMIGAMALEAMAAAANGY